MDFELNVPHQETLNTAGARLLYRVMSGLSEDYYCAGWLGGCEYALWANLTGQDVAGMKAWKISKYELEELRLAYEIAGGWIIWSHKHHDLIFLPEAEWLDHLAGMSA